MPDKCPRCEYPIEVYPALSRLSTADNKIWVCSTCGVDEAIQQYNNDGVAVDWRK
jgi:ribosomal protein L37AE/L43A